MLKNVASQKIVLLAIDTAANTPKTGDSDNITAYVSKDDGTVTVLGDTSATELDATNAPGLYSFDLTQSETNADKLVFSGKSSTSGIRIVPKEYQTVPQYHSSQAIDSNGRVDVSKIKGIASVAQAGYVGIDWGFVANQDTIINLSGTTIATVTTASNMVTASTLLNSSAAGPYAANTWGSKLDTAYTNTTTIITNLATVAGYVDTEVAAIYSRIGAPAGASIAADIAAMSTTIIASLSGTDVTVSSPVADDGTIRIIQGDTYAYTDGRSLPFTFDATPGVTGATIVLKITRGGTTTSITGTVLTSTTGYFERTSAQTAAMDAGEYTYEVEVTLSSGNVMTTHTGLFYVDADI